MTDPSEDADPAPAGTAANVPAGVPGPTIADHDGGVARRLTTRCRVAASVLVVFATLFLLFGVLRSWSASAALFLLLAAGDRRGGHRQPQPGPPVQRRRPAQRAGSE